MRKRERSEELREKSEEYRAGGGTVSSKGQITVPKAVRERYSLGPGTEVEFELHEDGALLRRKRPAPHPVWAMIGSLKGRWPKGFPRDVDSYIDFVRGGSYAGKKRDR